MKHSEQLDKIAPALLAAQKEVSSSVVRNQRGNFGNYATLEAAVEAVKVAYNNHGLTLQQFYEESEPNQIAVTTLILHESGQYISGTATCPLPKPDPQGYGSASTYVRRYSILAAAFMAPEDDDGKAASPHTSGRPQAAPRTAPAQRPTPVRTDQPKKPWSGRGEVKLCPECNAPEGRDHVPPCSKAKKIKAGG